MEKKEKNSKTEGKDIMRLIVSAVHLILVRVYNFETCAHSCGWETWKDNHGLFVCLFVCLLCSVFYDTLFSNTEYISWN